MVRMNSDIKKLYWFHFLNSIALTAVANFLFLDKLFLRMDLNMSQFGLIKGVHPGIACALEVESHFSPLALRQWARGRGVKNACFAVKT